MRALNEGPTSPTSTEIRGAAPLLRGAGESEDIPLQQRRCAAGSLDKWSGHATARHWLPGLSLIRLSRPFLYQPLACVTVLSLLVTFLGAEYGYATLDVAADISLGVGTPLALLLAFRLNISYTRWLEGRTLWGKLVESSRSIVSTAVSATLAAQSDGCGGEEARATQERAREVAGWCVAFAYYLRGRLHDDDPAEATPAVQQLRDALERLLGARAVDELEAARAAGRNVPLRVLCRLRGSASRLLRGCGGGGAGPAGSASALLASELLVGARDEELFGTLSGCERLTSTPTPPGYVAILRSALLAFLALLPFIVAELGLVEVPVCLLTSLILLGIEDVAVQLEVPFGDDENDLPLAHYCVALEADLAELLDLLPAPDDGLAEPPKNA
ncbi:hypothetical protein EMIHUDRAFT_435039 [Emiliania huxleyi CCMP1516]|uniref:Bestrophin n=2 Tax=Emiliania huxleyi TaxID=2903 RepID=A0A0D3JS77_EMIH1|nr:hypothetical protein EMIHUDRAFT_435039 [Emiliania huxleyi CCMP1516]EOD26362.1 hypothetical protein EMIHUDRAFT_435039 [Emiliania huxleyi CCMP1516]|eukprot:XP_005778791.1 hypothetical protein EMIHUDRAFT_435039 [Emiliania huxleyi CCMP1516]